nr:hypothetical protein 6 [Gammaproteobacteria bacterium]
MKALIDADILPYEFGGMVQLEDPEKPLEWEIVRAMVDDRIQQIVEQTGSDSFSLYLTDSKSNFRLNVATILPYKGHRKQEKPYHWEAIRQHLIDNYDAQVQYGIEADDGLGIQQWKRLLELKDDLDSVDHTQHLPHWQTVICSRDKDLHMIPGWHYVWPAGKQEEKFWFQDEVSAIRCFYRQLLTGDTSDNILGLYGVGSSSQLVKRLEDIDEESLMFEVVFKAYKDRFGSYASQFILENAALLWILREEPIEVPFFDGTIMSPESEVKKRLNNLGGLELDD